MITDKTEEEIKEIKLERLKLSIQEAISCDLIQDATIDIDRLGGMVAEQLIVSMRAHIASQELDYVRIEYPETWWDAFKERWFPELLKKVFPVKYHTTEVEARALYTELVIPEFQTTLYVRTGGIGIP